MMFNKILVLTDQGVKIQDYQALAKYVFKNLNPLTDISFSHGPMDVLDHSCSKLGFGGKMCIDGTTKFEEEKEENLQDALVQTSKLEISSGLLDDLKKFSEIKSANTDLLQLDIPCIILSISKNRKGHIRTLHQQICETGKNIAYIKMILYVEHTVDPNDFTTALWRFCNNLDPKRDSILYQGNSPFNSSQIFACIGFDGTRKTNELDNFQRDWPNIIVADESTIQAVDKKWNDLGIGALIPSPSLKFKEQMYGEEAVAG